MNLYGYILKWSGWKVEITAQRREKCVICVAPHTSNYDFILGLFAYRSLGRKANFLMKESWFFFPLKYIFTYFGGIPVPRKRGSELTDAIIRKFNSSEYMNLAVTPEGTRSRTERWRTGFLRIAYGANVPIQLGVIDYKNKSIIISEEFTPSGNIEADMEYVAEYYQQFPMAARKPEKFALPKA